MKVVNEGLRRKLSEFQISNDEKENELKTLKLCYASSKAGQKRILGKIGRLEEALQTTQEHDTAMEGVTTFGQISPTLFDSVHPVDD